MLNQEKTLKPEDTIANELSAAAVSAAQGNTWDTKLHICRAKNTAQSRKLELTEEQWKEIHKLSQLAKVNSIPLWLERAADCADQGLIRETRGKCTIVRQFARETNTPITSQQMKDLIKYEVLAQQNAVANELKGAANLAQRGDVFGCSIRISHVFEILDAVSPPLFTPLQQKRIDKKINEIRRLARIKGVDVELTQAAAILDQGRVHSLDHHINTAREYAADAGISLTEKQEEQIALMESRANTIREEKVTRTHFKTSSKK